MKKIISLPLLLQFFVILQGSGASCPTDFNYVHQIPWNSACCRSGDGDANCCQSLLSLFSVGLAQYLKDSSMFGFPDDASAIACVNEFQQQVSSLPTAALSPALVPRCLNDTSKFVSSPRLCDGIQMKRDWIDRLGLTAIDSSCQGDLSDLSVCSLCVNGARQVTSRLVRMNKNMTETTSHPCFDFAVRYAANVNELGPKSPKTASCALRLPILRPKSKDNNRLVLITTSAGAAVVFSLLAFLSIYLSKARRNRDAAHRQFVNRNRDLFRATMKPATGVVWFSIHEMKAATQNFSRDNLIGQGGFGTVYRGTLSNGQPVAVKSIRNCSAEGDAEFLNEVEIINYIRHRNLVALRGCCVASDDNTGHQRFLIYDYMANGSLDEHLFGRKSKDPLSWAQRKNIVLGTAKGLAYLHGSVQPAIYHRDIKPANILLDDEMNVRVSDFGLAKIMTRLVEGESHMTTKVAGTHGYLAPEYSLYGHLTEKSDVYSFGAVLLEVISGRKALDTSLESASDYLIADWAWKLVKAGKVLEVIDERICNSGPMNVMARFVSVGILCSHVMVAYRPTIAEALKMLQGDIEIPEIPDRPLPISYQSLSYRNSST